MTDALVPDTALVPVEEFRQRLPEGWFVRGWDARLGFDDWTIRPERVLNVELWHHRGARVALRMNAAPDWEWLVSYLNLAASVPFNLEVMADRPA